MEVLASVLSGVALVATAGIVAYAGLGVQWFLVRMLGGRG